MRSRLARRCLAHFPTPAMPLVAGLLLAAPARAAEVTRIAETGEVGAAMAVDLDIGYAHVRKKTRIQRESATGGSVLLLDELQHFRTVDEFPLRLAVGFLRGVELHVLVPFVVRDVQDWDYAKVGGVSVEPTSTLKNNTLDVSGCAGPGTCTQQRPIVPSPGHSERFGVRDPTVGIAWSPINEVREFRLRSDMFPPAKPVATWVVGFDYTAPLVGDVDDPSRYGAASSVTNPNPPVRASEVKKAHVFSLWTAFSKRFSALDPYVMVRASAPLARRSGRGVFSNCENLAVLSEVAPANCASAAWKDDSGYAPPYEGTVTVGTELVALDDGYDQRKLAFDFRGDLHYFGPGRDYTQVTDALGKLTYADEYLNMTGSVGVYGRVARWLRLSVHGSVGVDTPHLLTHESLGKDLDGDGAVSISGGRGVAAPEQNPNYDFRLDQPGRRLRAAPAVLWGFSGSVSLSF